MMVINYSFYERTTLNIIVNSLHPFSLWNCD